MTFQNSMILLRSGAVVGLAWGLLSLGCVVPQDDIVFPTLPPRKNFPLRIVRQEPLSREVTYLAGNCATPFSVNVVDPDVGDRIRYQWYVDRTVDSTPVGSGFVNPGSGDKRVTSSAALNSRLAGLIDGKRHVVEVFVTDGEFAIDNIGPPSYPSGGTFTRPLLDGGTETLELDQAYLDSYLWLVEVQRCP
jgi:hypothetical protein